MIFGSAGAPSPRSPVQRDDVMLFIASPHVDRPPPQSPTAQRMSFGAPVVAPPRIEVSLPPSPLFLSLVGKLLAADDDAGRLVVADALAEAGDARGEFIALQLAEARVSDAGRAARIAELLARYAARWVPPGVLAERSHFHRGFLHRATWFGATDTNHVEWQFVRHLTYRPGLERPPPLEGLSRLRLTSLLEAPRSVMHEVLEAPPATLRALEGRLTREDLEGAPGAALRRLTHLGTLGVRLPFATLSLGDAEAVIDALPPVPHVRLIDVWAPLEALRARLSRWPSLRALEIVCL
jgi:uncharacterized protein (TIGR02996 family)